MHIPLLLLSFVSLSYLVAQDHQPARDWSSELIAKHLLQDTPITDIYAHIGNFNTAEVREAGKRELGKRHYWFEDDEKESYETTIVYFSCVFIDDNFCRWRSLHAGK